MKLYITFQGRQSKRNRKQIINCKKKQNQTIPYSYFNLFHGFILTDNTQPSGSGKGSQTNVKIQRNLKPQNISLSVGTRHKDKSPTSGLSQSIQGKCRFFSSLRLYQIKRQSHCVVSRNISMGMRVLCLLIELTAYPSKLPVAPAHLSAAGSQCHCLAHQSPV